MQQQIDFYQYLSHRQTVDCSASDMAKIGGIALGIFLLIALLVSAFNLGLQSEFDQARQQKQQLAGELKAAKSNATDRAEADISALQQKIRARQTMLRQLKSDAAREQTTFSQQLAGLGRQNLRGLWLDRIALESGGSKLTLSGEATRGTLIPVYLQALSADEVFTGHRFDLMKIAQPDTDAGRQGVTDTAAGDQLVFELTALPDTHQGGNS